MLENSTKRSFRRIASFTMGQNHNFFWPKIFLFKIVMLNRQIMLNNCIVKWWSSFVFHSTIFIFNENFLMFYASDRWGFPFQTVLYWITKFPYSNYQWIFTAKLFQFILFLFELGFLIFVFHFNFLPERTICWTVFPGAIT